MEMGQETLLGVPWQGHGLQRALAQQEWEACASRWPRLLLCTPSLRRLGGAKPEQSLELSSKPWDMLKSGVDMVYRVVHQERSQLTWTYPVPHLQPSCNT